VDLNEAAGMTLTVAVRRRYFPDGSEFEGVGIRPDVEVHTSIDDAKKGRDPVLVNALGLSEKHLMVGKMASHDSWE
jgi:C-terminal processing protease CtpA/Prc